MRTKPIIDLSSKCASSLSDKLETGRFERHQLFSKFFDTDEYADYLKDLETKGVDLKDYTAIELNYMYFEYKTLFKHDIFHEYYFEQLRGSKQTGEYRLSAMVFHKG